MNDRLNGSLFPYDNDEVVVTAGTGVQRKVTMLGAISTVDVADLSIPAPSVANLLGGRVAGVMAMEKSADAGTNLSEFWIRGIGTFDANSQALVLIDGKEGNLNDINIEDIVSFSVLKDASATAVYGTRGANGVILIVTKKGAGAEPEVRKNFNETAFFFPQLRTNEKGETLISFTVPESNTTWRFRALAHDKDARVGTLEQLVYTRKELMVTPNMPRFVRQGDKTSISTKISNLSENAISGDVRIEFFDPATDKAIDLNIANQKQTFSIEKDGSSSVSWTFDIPADIELIGCRIVAQNETFSDGEQHVLAVLSNRMLVTESMPIDVTKSGTSTFIFDKLNDNKSATTENYSLTLEYASNPAWYAVQALPSMANPTNENAVNWFASYYVNTLGSSIVRQYPKVASIIQTWLQQGGDKETLVSKLQKDEELKAVLLEETPWVLEDKTETEQMQRLSLLFDLNNTKQLTDAATRKLQELQNDEGGWCWYKGFYPSRSITQYILYGYATLQRTGQVQYPEEVKMMQMDALKYIDKQLREEFNRLKKNNKDWEKITSVTSSQLEFAYVRSFYRDIPIDQETREAERFYTNVASKNWTKLSMYQQSILSVTLKRNGEKDLASKIAKSIKEHAVNDKKLGMYWPNNRNNVFFSMSAISAHTFLMEALQENGATEKEMNAMKHWLLNQKQTQIWESTHATIDAINIILSTGSDWFQTASTETTIKVGGQVVDQPNKELGTGHFKKVWTGEDVDNSMAKVEVTTPSDDPAYGALYWQYYEDLDNITAQSGELNVEKQLFKENVTATGKSLSQITSANPLKVGDRVVVRLTIKVDKDMEFVQVKDMRAPCFEPEQTVSGVKWANSLIYYQMPKDASTNFYFDRLSKGTYVLEYPVYVNRTGEYSNGITTIQCLYAPQYISHTQGIKVIVKE
jgi:TonB-dependent SusC/RagA subfamily outer membrane receptor